MGYYKESTSDIFNTIMSTVSGAASQVERIKADRNTSGYLTRSSIMKASKDLVMSFPVICPDTVSPNVASMLTKAIERNCVTTLQMLFSAANLTGDNGFEVIKKWHTNMDNSIDMDDYLDYLDALTTSNEDAKLLADGAKFTNDMLTEMKNIKFYTEADFSELPVSRFTVGTYNGFNSVNENGDISGDIIHEYNLGVRFNNAALAGLTNNVTPNPLYTSDFGDLDIDDPVAHEIQKLVNTKYASPEFVDSQEKIIGMVKSYQEYLLTKASYDLKKQQADYNKERDKTLDDQFEKKLDMEAKRHNWQVIKDTRQLQMELNKYNLDQRRLKAALMMDQQKVLDSELDYFHKQLISSDVRKINELVPSMIVIRFNSFNTSADGTEKIVPQQFIAGVKARLIVCSSMEIIDAIRATEKNSINLLNLVKATTKETSFCRDFVAAIDQAKIDAKRNSKLSKTSPIWRSLQWRSNKSVLKRLTSRKANDAGAITTLVLTSEEVNFMKNNYGIDLNVPAKAKEIMEAYNLMCFCIVDEEVEVVRFLFDGEKYFQDYAFNALEKETGDNSYKKVINLLSKVSR